ncbi:MAG: DUF1961 family protein [Victivallaceae bacterium]
MKPLLLLLGLASLPLFGGDILYQDDFAKDNGQWYREGGRSVEFKDGRLVIDADAPDKKTGIVATVWNRQRFAGDLQIDVDVCVESSLTNTNNINFFFYYTVPPDNADPLLTTDQRQDGNYSAYHKLNGYIVTFLNSPENKDAARVRIRRCPGFKLLKETYAGENKQGTVYRLTITRRGDKIAFSVDGKQLLEATDPEPFKDGYFGFRTFQTKLWFDNLVIRRLGRPSPSE